MIWVYVYLFIVSFVQKAVVELAYQITTDLNANIMVLSTPIVATLVLLHRDTGVSVTVLNAECEWLVRQILNRGGRADYPNKGGEAEYVQRALALMETALYVRGGVVEV